MKKSVLKSKTFWMQVLLVLGMLVPAIQENVVNNPELFASIWGGLSVALRFITKDKIFLVDK